MRADRSSAAASFALLVVAQVASAYVVPEVVVMRVKRSPEPEPMRSFSFSGFNPNGQMAAFTGMAEYPMAFGNYGPPRASPHYGQPTQNAYGPPTQDAYGPPTQDAYGSSSSPSTHTQDSYGPPPSGAEQPAAAEPSKQLYGGVGQPEYGSKPVDSKEQSNSVEQTDNKKQHRGRDGPSSNAEASFNAWFPIMFGVFPNGNGNGGTGQQGNSAGGRGQEQGSGFGNGFDRSSGGTTVIANSVSNGRHGVATSHAIAYGSPRTSQK